MVTFSSGEEPKSKPPPVTRRDRWATRNFKTDQRLRHPPPQNLAPVKAAAPGDYECGKLRLSAEMAIRFAIALEVTTDELLRSNGLKPLRRKPSRRVLRRMERIQDLPPRRRYFVLKALDALLSSSVK
jgi:hypothetical protein